MKDRAISMLAAVCAKGGILIESPPPTYRFPVTAYPLISFTRTIMRLFIVALFLCVAVSVVNAQTTTVRIHRHHNTTTKTTGVANARAHGGRAYAKGHRIHRKGNTTVNHAGTAPHSADIYFGTPNGKANGKSNPHKAQ
jgi:hypothetical protein